MLLHMFKFCIVKSIFGCGVLRIYKEKLRSVDSKGTSKETAVGRVFMLNDDLLLRKPEFSLGEE